MLIVVLLLRRRKPCLVVDRCGVHLFDPVLLHSLAVLSSLLATGTAYYQSNVDTESKVDTSYTTWVGISVHRADHIKYWVGHESSTPTATHNL